MDVSVDALLDVASWCGRRSFNRIALPYMRTDMARNAVVKLFLENATEPNDALVMLDCDHAHPPDVVERLVSHPPERGVVGALYFRRGEPYDPLFFVVAPPESPGGRGEEGKHASMTGKHVGLPLRAPAEWEQGRTYECDVVATGAMCIRRWVFESLDAAGVTWPYFRYAYPEPTYQQTEDVYFGLRCHEAGIKHYCDTGLVIPHLTVQGITLESWEEARRLQQQEVAA